jgi:hypothetical protein
MKRKVQVIGMGLVLVLLLCGCVAPTQIAPVTQKSTLQPPRSDVRVVTEGNTTTEYNIPVITSLSEGFGVKGDTVTIKDLYPCYKGQVELTVINGADRAREFHLNISPESNLQGWEQFPAEYYKWLSIAPSVFRLMPNGSQTVSIAVSMPCDADYSGKKARCRVVVEDWSQAGLIQIAVASKWFIETY